MLRKLDFALTYQVIDFAELRLRFHSSFEQRRKAFANRDPETGGRPHEKISLHKASPRDFTPLIRLTFTYRSKSIMPAVCRRHPGGA
jgi:hypothetical protein